MSSFFADYNEFWGGNAFPLRIRYNQKKCILLWWIRRFRSFNPPYSQLPPPEVVACKGKYLFYIFGSEAEPLR